MDAGGIGGALVALVLAALAGAVVARAPDLLTGLFGSRQLGWPRGVQEDDDARWSWSPPRRRPDDVIPVAIDHVRGRVHRR